jgi:hypothetical protein
VEDKGDPEVRVLLEPLERTGGRHRGALVEDDGGARGRHPLRLIGRAVALKVDRPHMADDGERRSHGATRCLGRHQRVRAAGRAQLPERVLCPDAADPLLWCWMDNGA